MANSRPEQEVQWSASASKALNDATWQDSDALTINVDDFSGVISVEADLTGTAQSGDTVEVRLLRTCGDTAGDTGDDYDSSDAGEHIMTLDCNRNDPEVMSREVTGLTDSIKFSFKAPQGASRTITVRARFQTHRLSA